MFVGHLAVALAAKRAEPRLSLAALVAGAFGLDLLWPVFLLLGVETVVVDPGNTRFTPLDFQSYPWSHSLAMSVLWGLVAGVLAASMMKRRRVLWLMTAVVVSHWVLDFVSHRPDLPLWPGGPLEGLGLWNSIAGTIVIEGALLLTGLSIYLSATTARDARGRWALWSFVVFVTAIWISGPFSPPPPSTVAIASVGLLMAVVFPLWAAWIERHRV